MNKKYLSTLIVASSMFASAASYAQCFGNVYSMNAGRGHVGALIDIKESASIPGSNYALDAATRAQIHSKALFSSSAMAYDKNTDRIYYASVPAPVTYYMENAETFFTEEELKNLDFHAQRTTPSTLAYFDVATQKHVEVATTRFGIYRMAFHPESGELYASDAKRLFKVSPETGEVTEIGEFPLNTRAGGFTTWGDFEFYNNELLYVTSGRTFTVNLSTADLTLKAFHFVDFVTSVTTDQNGQLIMAAKNQNVTGNINSNQLWRLKPETGEKVQIGLFPTRISAMATVTSEEHECYESTSFASDAENGVMLFYTSANGEQPRAEGDFQQFDLAFDEVTKDGNSTIFLANVDGTAKGGIDYSLTPRVYFQSGDGIIGQVDPTLTPEGTEIVIPKGAQGFSVYLDILEDNIEDDNETFTLKAWMKPDKSDLTVAATTTIQDTKQNGVRIFYTSANGEQPRAEGDFQQFDLVFDEVTKDGTSTIFLANVDNTAKGGIDYSLTPRVLFQSGDGIIGRIEPTLTPEGTEIVIPKGAHGFSVYLDILEDSIKDDNETFTLKAWMKSDKSDLTVAAYTTIKDTTN
ncbi:hypothetical protein [Grimontia sp. AD028]|uniref:hypothetical protein n=1 Tax=Grimontia sp. AD028 TaxID=1581149 RepID=UPI000697FBA6|nr:hypothetical protein [Grimontia sp. AD028]